MAIKIKDYTKIKEITFTLPELMKENAKDEIILFYKNLLKKESTLQELRVKVRELEEEIKKDREHWNLISNVAKVEFDDIISEYKTHKASFSVYGCGNDSYGKVSYDK